MSRRRRKKKKRMTLSGLTVLLVLCVVMILFDLYMVMRASLSSSSGSVVSAEAEQTEETESPAVSSLPQIIQAEQPDVQIAADDTQAAADDTQMTSEAEEPAAQSSTVSLDGDWQNSSLSFRYDTVSMWVSESGGVISLTDLEGSTLPRMDLQVLDNAQDLTQEEFAALAGAAVRAYFSVEPEADAVTEISSSVADGVYEMQLHVEQTSVSPELQAWVRLEEGVLTTLLLEEDTGEETAELWLAALRSVSVP